MIENFLYLVEQYGFVPHANRIYFSRRSLPPVLSRLVLFYVTATNDQAFASAAVPFLDLEVQAWSDNTVTVNGHKLYVYGDVTRGPRPESYREDAILASGLATETEKQNLYAELRAATESGFEFSSRWFIKNGTNEGSRVDTKCRSIIPVELNSIFYRNFITIATFYRSAGNITRAEEFEKNAADLLVAIAAVLWNEEDGIWYDYDLINQKPRRYYGASNFIPLASYAYDPNDSERLATAVLNYIAKNNIDSYMGGLPTTFVYSDENWDYPNVLPILQWVAILGLKGLNVESTSALAEKWALRWLANNLLAYQRDGVMYDKVSLENLYIKL